MIELSNDEIRTLIRMANREMTGLSESEDAIFKRFIVEVPDEPHWWQNISDVSSEVSPKAALGMAPIQTIGESDANFIERYKKWFRDIRHAALGLE